MRTKLTAAALALWLAGALCPAAIASTSNAASLPAAHSASAEEAPWLPEGADVHPAETRPSEALRRLLIAYYQIPEEAWAAARYTYTRIDLDGDGRKEILAVTRSPYTSGTGGDSALLLSEENGRLTIRQSFTLIRTPILAADTLPRGLASEGKALILRRSGGGAPAETVCLPCRSGRYPRVSRAVPIADLRSVQGTILLDGTAPEFSLCPEADAMPAAGR